MRRTLTLAAFGITLIAVTELGAVERHQAHLLRLVDEDTVRLDIHFDLDITLRNQCVRIFGIDAPELRGPERERGETSKAALEQFLNGKALSVELRGKGKYGRRLGDLFAGEKSVALWMVRQHHARVYRRGRHAPELPTAGSLLRPASPTPSASRSSP